MRRGVRELKPGPSPFAPPAPERSPSWLPRVAAATALVVAMLGTLAVLWAAAPSPAGVESGVLIGVDDPESPAAWAGLRTGDRLLAVNGTEVVDWDHARALLDTAPVVLTYHDALVAYAPDSPPMYVALRPRSWDPGAHDTEPAYTRWGLASARLFVWEAVDDYPAARAGLQADDRMVEADGRPLSTLDDLLQIIAGSVGAAGDPLPISLTVVRSGRALELTPHPVREPDGRVVLGFTTF